jgi:hypothetical protein
MPAFSFEKISPPARRGQQSSAPSVEKQRGFIHQIVDRFADARAKKALAKKTLDKKTSDKKIADKARSVSTHRKAQSAADK